MAHNYLAVGIMPPSIILNVFIQYIHNQYYLHDYDRVKRRESLTHK